MKIAALDIGGTSIKAGMTENGRLLWKKEVPTDAMRGGEAVMQTAEGIVAAMEGFDRLGISTAGQVNTQEGCISFANENIPGYTGMKVRDRFQEKFRVPVAVENDVNSAAVGEAQYGAGRDVQEFLCLTFGTGIGGAIVVDKKIYTGYSFSAGEFGHILTHPGGRPCNCGLSGCYERYASSTALVLAAKELDPELSNGRVIFQRLQEPAVQAVVDRWMEEILYGLTTLIHIFNPRRIVLGGGIMNEKYILDGLRERLPKHIMSSYSCVELFQAELHNDAGLLGASWLASCI